MPMQHKVTKVTAGRIMVRRPKAYMNQLIFAKWQHLDCEETNHAHEDRQGKQDRANVEVVGDTKQFEKVSNVFKTISCCVVNELHPLINEAPINC
jgi:hypothetical protein